MMKTIRIGLALGICLALAATDAPFAQGQGNNKKENTEAKAERQKAEEAREKGRSGKKTNLPEAADQKKEEAREKQGNPKSKGNQNKADKQNQRKGNENRADENNGNAYGRNKGNLSGREFGQARAAAARRNGEEKREYLHETITYGDDKARDARTRIERALEVLEQDRKARKVSDAEYNARRMRIDRAEQAVKVLEDRVAAGKQLVITIE